MSITVTGKLNKTANQFVAGEGRGFGVRLGVQFYNRETQQKDWTNYEAAVFANIGKQSEFYESVLVEGSIIEISGSGCQIKTWESNNGAVHSISILDAKIGFVFTNEQNAPKPNGKSPQSIPAPAADEPPFDDDIPF